MKNNVKKVLIIGAFAFDTLDTGGQPVKTRELYYGLSEKLGDDKVDYLETVNWKRKPLKLLFDFFKKAKKTKTIIMLPAQRGVLVFSRLLLLLKIVFGKKLYYDVVGGWLPSKISNNKKLLKILSYFDGIMVETTRMKEVLNAQGLDNVTIVRNFKDLRVIDKKTNRFNKGRLKVCTFSRIIKEKGIEDAVKAVELANESVGRDSIFLDIYGQVDDSYKIEFDELVNNFSATISFKGIIEPSQSTQTLLEYDVLLFLTYYDGEGLAGTLIDAFAAGLPVICSDWKYNSEFIHDEENGFLVKIHDVEDVASRLIYLLNNQNILKQMSMINFNAFNDFSKETVIKQILELIEQ